MRCLDVEKMGWCEEWQCSMWKKWEQSMDEVQAQALEKWWRLQQVCGSMDKHGEAAMH